MSNLLFKVHILYPPDSSNLEKKQVQCSVCETTAKCMISSCKSGPIPCKSYEVCDNTIKGKKESGDYKSEKEFDPDADVPPIQIRQSVMEVTDLAGGDRDSKQANQDITGEVKKFYKKENIFTHEEHFPKNNTEITMQYKNLHFQESKSSVTANTDEYSKNTEGKEEDEVENYDADPRPVVCPVKFCSKIVTIDSFMVHFLFDHSKVPRTTLDDTKPQEFTLKAANFSTEIQCVTTYIIETQKRRSQMIKMKMDSVNIGHNSKKDNKLLLLLAVKLPTSSLQLPNAKYDPSTIFSRSIHTQTEKINERCSGITSHCLSRSSADYKPSTGKSVLDEDEVFLLWLCKLDDVEKVFSITLLGEDRRRGYCYIGDAVHVRDKRDPSSLYDKSECLIVKGSAINRLFDPKGHITAIVSLL